MKRIFVLIIGLHVCFAYAQKKADPIVMTVGNIEVPLSEFLFIAQKEDSGVNLLDKKSRENYVELFKTFKLKVADAQSHRIQESMRFQSELSTYQSQLAQSFLSDTEGERQAIWQVYDQGKELLSLSHIMFMLPEKSLPKDTLAIFNKANEVYKRLQGGADFEAVGNALLTDDNAGAVYEEVDYMIPLQSFKELVTVAYSLSPGSIAGPVRTPLGYHIIRVNRKYEDQRFQVAHIFLPSPETLDLVDEQLFQKEAYGIYEKIKNGQDFAQVAEEFSLDENTKYNGGILPPFGLGVMLTPFEQAVLALQNTGDVSEPVRTRVGYHIIKLLKKFDYPPFEELEGNIRIAMEEGDLIHKLNNAFVERQKKKFGYTFFPAAYNELLQLCDNYFPTDSTFYDLASQMQKPIMQLQGIDFPQYEFADYIKLRPASVKTFSKDYLNDQYDFFIRDILTELTKKDLENNPEFVSLINEYHDGILFFEVSDSKVWSKPIEEQEKLEQEWIQELKSKYQVTINKKIINNIKKYLK